MEVDVQGAGVVKMALRDLVENLERPEDYFSGLAWGGQLLPEKILCFKRLQQDHTTKGWEGISAKAGRYDQHGRFVLLVAIEGEGKLGVESEVCQVKEGEALIMFPHQIHYYVELAEEFCWLFVTFELRPEDVEKMENLRGGARQVSAHGRDLLDVFLSDYQEEKALEASVGLAKVLEELGSGLHVQPVEDAVLEKGVVGRVKRYVIANLEGDLANPALAQEMKVSESYLRAVFREETGVSLGHFVRSARLVRAGYLLDEREKSVSEVAEECGFQSVTSFTRAFRRTYEMTPSEYRRRFAQKKI